MAYTGEPGITPEQLLGFVVAYRKCENERFVEAKCEFSYILNFSSFKKMRNKSSSTPELFFLKIRFSPRRNAKKDQFTPENRVLRLLIIKRKESPV